MGAKFVDEPLRERTDEICNPRRGWYEIYSFDIDKEPDFEELKWCLRKNQTLAFLLWNLGAVRSSFLAEEQLERVDRTLRFFEDAGKSLILRFAYDTEGDARNREPSDIKLILCHITQLGRIIKKHESGVYVVQGLFTGSWGEMHHTAYGTKEQVRALANAMRGAVGDKIFLAVRKPVYLRYLSDGIPKGVGLFNDGLFGSETHLATYGKKPKSVAAWDEMWCAEDETDYVARVCERVAHGGEVVKGMRHILLEEIEETLRTLRISYLNCAHDKRLLDEWRETQVATPGVWQGHSWFDYIGAHLGYRFVVAQMTAKKRFGNRVRLSVRIKNTGYGPLYEEARLLFYMNGSQIGKDLLPAPFLPNQEYESRVTIPAEAGTVTVSLQSCADNAPIIFASAGNRACEEGIIIGHFE